jgi:protein-S-isoprenylcysteine O-methyltransferase Ste14
MSTNRTPLVANFTTFGLFLAALLIFSSSPTTSMALALALSGCALAAIGAAVVRRSRAELGAAWSLLPKANRDTGLVTTGPYRLVRHPIYLGHALIAAGIALAFGNRVALLVVVCGVIPTFAWRAHVEERELSRMFGDRFAAYRQRTGLIIPRVL